MGAEPSRSLSDRSTSAAVCVECGGSQPVVYKNGAWLCPRHRDEGTVRFVPLRDADPLKRGVPTIIYDSHGYADIEAYDRLQAENERLREDLGVVIYHAENLQRYINHVRVRDLSESKMAFANVKRGLALDDSLAPKEASDAQG